MNFKEGYQNFKKKMALYTELTRGYSLLTSMAPWFAATAAATVSPHFYTSPRLYFVNIVMTFIAVICLHLGGNLLDDYIDLQREMKKGTPLNNIDFESSKGKAKLIINGTFSLGKVRKTIGILFGIAILIGLYFTAIYGTIILKIAFAGALLCVFYPYASKFYLGEIVIGTLFGPFLVTGTYIALTGIYSPQIMLISAAIGLMTVVLLETHSLMEFDYDRKVHKRTLCTLVRSKTASLVLIALEVLIAYALLIYLAVTKQLSYWLILSIVLTLPLTIKLIKSLDDYNKVKDVKFIPKWYLGPMENWGIIQSEQYEYFMYRFYIARNIGFIFSVSLAFVLFFTLKMTQLYV